MKRKDTKRAYLIRLEPSEWEIVDRYCEELGIKKSTYFRILIHRARIEVLRR